jgi:hypothetical protein
MDGKAARVAETEAGAEGKKIASRAQLHRRQLKPFHRPHAIIVFSLASPLLECSRFAFAVIAHRPGSRLPQNPFSQRKF